jgi:pyruvate kinase
MKIKLLVTLGPSSLNKLVISRLDQFNIFVFRINLSHTPIDKLEETIKKIRSFSDTPICLDSEGAQIRNQYMKGGTVFFQKDEIVKIHFDEIEGDEHNISFHPDFVAKSLIIGDVINIDFNLLSLKVIEIKDNYCNAIVLNDGMVGSNKATDLNRRIELPSLTEKDLKAIEIGKQNGINHFALSFAGSQQDVELFRSKVGMDKFIISKIESRKGLQNLNGILDVSDAILIDRGDLSRQVPIEKIPFFQRRIVSLARSKGIQAFVATNLLETMTTTKVPSRAEVNDIVSTLITGANGLVLAAETAIGKYPVECAEMIKSLVDEYEKWTPNTSINELMLS